MNGQQATEATKALPYPKRDDYDTKDAWQAARRAYYEGVSSVETQFRKWLAKEYAPWLAEETQNLIWGKAWAYGHYSGYQEVEDHYIDLASFAEDVVSQNRD